MYAVQFIVFAYLGFTLWMLWAEPVGGFLLLAGGALALLIARFPLAIVFILFFILGLQH